jgi:dienelactone hydrolase
VATPTRTQHAVEGALGEILVDVRAASRGAAQPAVLLLHGFKGFKDYAFLPVYAERLARAGFVAITASVSGAGVDAVGDFTRTERFAANTYSKELDDLHCVVRALQQGALDVAVPTSLGVVGHSRGGGMALLLSRETPAVAATVTWAGIGHVRRHTDAELEAWRRLGTIKILHQRLRIHLPLHYDVVEDCLAHEHGRLSIPEAARLLGKPWLQVHGTADGTVTIAEADRLAEHAGSALTERLVLDGGDHTFGTKHPWSGATAAMEQVFDRTTRFLTQHLR